MSARCAIARDREAYEAVVRLARKLASRRKYGQAAVASQIAALHAAYNHHGSFIDPKLEEVLQTIGRHGLRCNATSGATGQRPKKRILHVLTAAKDVGGDSRFVWRWIQRHRACEYSVALTNQMHFQVPAALRDAVRESGGSIHVLDEADHHALARAARLREVAAGYDAVFLHIYVEDIVPTMAFYDRDGVPPVVFVVQADHQFFVGLGASDMVAHMRASGAELSAARRGVRPDRDSFLPIPLDPVVDRRPREIARASLGIPNDAVVLLSIARAVKYTPISGPSFAEAATPILERYPNSILLVLGPDNDGPWRAAYERTGGRLRALGQRSDTRPFYESADIYIDSFPFASNTSLLEAGSFGLPLVSYFPYSASSDVLGAGAPGIDETMLRVCSLEDYARTLTHLIEDQSYRREIGERTRDRICALHSGPGWIHCVDEILTRILSLPPGRATDGIARDETQSELDQLLSGLYRGPMTLGRAIERCTRTLPYATRLPLLMDLLRIDQSFAFGLFLPSELEKRLTPYMRGWRRLPVLRRLVSRPE